MPKNMTDDDIKAAFSIIKINYHDILKKVGSADNIEDAKPLLNQLKELQEEWETRYKKQSLWVGG